MWSSQDPHSQVGDHKQEGYLNHGGPPGGVRRSSPNPTLSSEATV